VAALAFPFVVPTGFGSILRSVAGRINNCEGEKTMRLNAHNTRIIHLFFSRNLNKFFNL
jgi:hypothetical protein